MAPRSRGDETYPNTCSFREHGPEMQHVDAIPEPAAAKRTPKPRGVFRGVFREIGPRSKRWLQHKNLAGSLATSGTPHENRKARGLLSKRPPPRQPLANSRGVL